MRRILSLIALSALAACSSSSDDGFTPASGGGSCSMTGQKQFVLDNMRAWYLWNNLLPANVDISQFATPEDLLASLTQVQPLDNFSFINSAEADSQFFGEGRFEGFGFSYQVIGNAMRLSNVIGGSPAAQGGLERGQTVLSLNGTTVSEILSNGSFEALDAVFDNNNVTFEVQELNNNVFTAPIAKAIVTIDPVPQWRIIPAGGGRMIGYIEFSTFISTATTELDAAFAAFRTNNVGEVIIDLRYNGGGLVSIAELLADYLGGFANDGFVFSKTRFNADQTTSNSEDRFSLIGNSINLSSLVIIATQGTASASELVTNGMDPYVDVTIVGDRTFGKPVGQIGLNFCDKILRPTSFQTLNAADFGDYFGGLPVDCPAADDLDIPIGAANDPNLVVALSFLENNACPTSVIPSGQSKPQVRPLVRPDRRGTPQREFLDAF